MRASSLYFVILCCLTVYVSSSQTSGSITTFYEYDAIGRLTRIVYSDSSSITYTYDRNGNILSITASESNSAPTDATAVIVTDEDMQSSPVVPTVTDPDDGDTHMFSIGSQPTNGTAAISNNALIYTPDKDFFGSDSFVFRATDTGGLSVDGTATVTVNSVNDPPAAGDDSKTTAEDTPVLVEVLGNDSDVENDPLQVESVNQAAFGTTDLQPDGRVEYSPNQDYNGQDEFDYIVSDGQGGLDTAMVALTVTPVNDAPGPFERTLPVDLDSTSSRDVEFTWTPSVDVDGDAVNYSLRIKVDQLDSTFTSDETFRQVDFDQLGVPSGRQTVLWSLIASDGTLATAPDNGEGEFVLPFVTAIEDELRALPASYNLEQNYPNPFNPETTISFSLPKAGKITLKIITLYGRIVSTLEDRRLEPGRYSIRWNANDQLSGVYICRLECRDVVLTRVMHLIK